MAPILSSLLRREDPSANSSLAYYLLIASVVIFVSGVLSMITYCILRRARRTRQRKAQALLGPIQTEANRSSSSLTSPVKEKSGFYDEVPHTPTGWTPPQIRLTLPEETIAGKRQSRVVVVTMSESGNVGYAPYHEPLPIYQQKESQRFQSLDLERIGGLKEGQAV